MRMVLHRLTPAVQHGDAADLGAEMARVGRDEAQRLGGGAEQDGVDRRLVLEGDGRHRGRQGEDHVEIGNGQQLRLPRGDPGFPSPTLAFGTVTVLAGFVLEFPAATGFAGFEHSPQCRCATLHDRPCGLTLLIR
jgi:hypothetical protein